MAILGKLIKKSIEITHHLLNEEGDAKELQNKQLKSLLYKAKDTAFGKYYGFEDLLQSEDIEKEFKARIPIFDYHTMHHQWWEKQQQYPDITWPGKPAFFALSSGTTGKKSKRIPITEDFLKSMKSVGTSMVKSLANFDFPDQLFQSEILMLSSSANLSKHENGHLEGEISGINVSNFPGWYDMFYRPGKDIAAINDWDKRVEAIAKEAPNWDIGAIAGIPSWVLLMIQKVIEVNNLNHIHEIWPNLTVYASGGVAFETYRNDFEKVTGKPLTIMDTYLASEGFFSYTGRPDTMEMVLALDHGYYFEFIPFDERGVDETGQLLDNPESHSISEVEVDQDYVLVITTCAGAWRYVIGDTIKFTNTNPHEILITGRTKFFLNVVGSQLSEEKLDAAILDVSEQIGNDINEYSVAAIKNEEEEYIHQWVVIADKSDIDESEVATKLDNSLKEANKNYKVARNKALKGIKVNAITKDKYFDFLESTNKKGGQVKIQKVMKSDKMNDLLSFINQ